jgi:DNA-binding GntR family transcriptional regulator
MSETLSRRAYGLIRSDILACRLQPGQSVAQSKLAEKYRLGLVPVREALQRLEHEGFVQPFPRFGYIITPITISDVLESFELRMMLEPATVRLAAVRASEEELGALAKSTEFGYSFGDDLSYTEFLRRNAEFHGRIAALTGNQLLVDTISRLMDRLTRLLHLGLGLSDGSSDVQTEHKQLAEALCDRNADVAEEIIKGQIARSEERVLSVVSRLTRTLQAGEE